MKRKVYLYFKKYLLYKLLFSLFSRARSFFLRSDFSFTSKSNFLCFSQDFFILQWLIYAFCDRASDNFFGWDKILENNFLRKKCAKTHDFEWQILTYFLWNLSLLLTQIFLPGGPDFTISTLKRRWERKGKTQVFFSIISTFKIVMLRNLEICIEIR